MARTPQGPHLEEIKGMIRKRGISLEALSQHFGYCKAAVAMALRKPWPKLQAKIAAFLDTTPHDLWPQWYAPDGTCTAGPRRRRNASSRAGDRNVYPSKAA